MLTLNQSNIMRTSIKIFLGAVLLLAIAVVSYDLRLNAEYRKGAYINPYYRYKKLPNRDFDEIELQSSTAIPVTVVKGDFNVLTEPSSGFVKVRQEGKKLIISAEFQSQYRSPNTNPVVYISCPTLLRFVADSKSLVRDDVLLDRAAVTEWKQSYIIGFREDSLAILADHAANVVLSGDTIGKLAATLGGGEEPNTGARTSGGAVAGIAADGEVMLKGSQDAEPMQSGNGPLLTIADKNQIEVTDFQVLEQGRILIKGTGIRQLTYTLADGASLTVTGAAARYLNLH
jgi:hypothetical protein